MIAARAGRAGPTELPMREVMFRKFCEPGTPGTPRALSKSVLASGTLMSQTILEADALVHRDRVRGLRREDAG